MVMTSSAEFRTLRSRISESFMGMFLARRLRRGTVQKEHEIRCVRDPFGHKFLQGCWLPNTCEPTLPIRKSDVNLRATAGMAHSREVLGDLRALHGNLGFLGGGCLDSRVGGKAGSAGFLSSVRDFFHGNASAPRWAVVRGIGGGRLHPRPPSGPPREAWRAAPCRSHLVFRNR